MKRDMAYKAKPLAMLPNGRVVWDDQLDYTLSERARVVAAHLLALLAVIAIVLFLSLPGQS